MLRAFTLIELMISITIMSLIAVVGSSALMHMQKSTDKVIALTGFYQDAGVIMKQVRETFAQRIGSTAMHVQLTPGGRQEITFMYVIPERMFSFSTTWRRPMRATSEVWCQWRFDPSEGLTFGRTREQRELLQAGKSSSSYAEFIDDIQADGPSKLHEGTYLVSQFNQIPVPQREWKYFINRGDASDLTATEAQAEVLQSLKKPQDADWVYTHEYRFGVWAAAWDPFYYLGNDGTNLTLQDTTPDYAAVCPPPNDGWNFATGSLDPTKARYHKSRLQVLGATDDPENPIYPSQLGTVNSRLELCQFKLVMNDGSIFDDGELVIPGKYLDPVAAWDKGGSLKLPAAMSDGRALTNAEINSRIAQAKDGSQDVHNAQPIALMMIYLLHDMPIDLNAAYVDENAEMGSINRLRWEFNELPVIDQTHEVLKHSLEAYGHTAIIISHLIELP